MPVETGQTAGSAEVQRLKPNAVGLVGVIFMAIATAAPITAMTGNVPVAVGFGNGIGAPAGYIFATIVLTIFSVGYVSMARHITATGAFYGYISHGLGRVLGMASGLLAVIAYVVFEASIVGIFAYFAKSTFDAQLGIDMPWEVYAAFMLIVTAILSYFDINLTAKVLGVFLVTEITVLAVMAIAILVQGGGPDGIPLEPINPVNAFKGNAGFGLFFAFWSWVGFESTAMYGEESRDPKRIIPRATLVAVTGVGIFYVFVSWMTISGNGLHQSVVTAQNDALGLFFGPTKEFVGTWAVDAFRWLLITGSFACGMAFHNCAARYLYAMGREGFLHKAMGRTHADHGSPHIASFVQTVIAVTIVGLFALDGQDPYLSLYTLTAILGTMAILIVQALCSFAVIGYYRNNHQEDRHWFRTFAAPLLGGIGMIVVIILLFQNLDAAAGPAAGTLFFKMIPWIVLGIFLLGIGGSLYLRATNPARYAVIGRVILEDSAERELDEMAPVGVAPGGPAVASATADP